MKNDRYDQQRIIKEMGLGNRGEYNVMNDQVLIVLIIAVAILIILVFFRDKLSRFGFKTKHFKANMETHNPGAINITKSSQKGEKNIINVETGDVKISEFNQDGKCQKLNIKKD